MAPLAGPKVRHIPRWLTVFLGFFLLGAAWAIATPYGGVPDEINHTVRAAGAGRGQIVGDTAGAVKERGETFLVPKGLVGADQCWQGDRRKPANWRRPTSCGQPPTGDTRLVRANSTASRYPPLFYLAVGVPLALWPSWTGVILARLISAGLVAGLLAAAAHGVTRWSRFRLLPAAILVAVTPITLHLAGSINPNGLEIAAGVALFAGLVPLLLEAEPPPSRGPLVLAGVAATTLALVRPLGPLWLAIIVGILVVPTTRQRLRRILGTRAGLVWTGAAGAAALATTAWVRIMKTGEPGWVQLPPRMSVLDAVRYEILERSHGYAEEMVGVMSWVDTKLPGLCYPLWFTAVGLLVVTAFGVAGWADRWRLGALAAASFAIPIAADAVNVNRYGFVFQGRYMLPIAVGLPIIAAAVLGARGSFPGGQVVRLTRVLACIVLPIHLVALWYTMIRWEYGIPDLPRPTPLNPFRGVWRPPLGAALPLLAAVAGAAFLLWYAWTAARTRQATAVSTDPAPRPGAGATPDAGVTPETESAREAESAPDAGPRPDAADDAATSAVAERTA